MRGHCQADGYDVPPVKHCAVVGLCIRLEPEQTSRYDMRPILTERIFESALDCTYKCHLLLNGRHGNKTEYEEHTERLDNMYQRAAIARLQEMHSHKDTIFLEELTPDTLDNTARLFVIMYAEANGLKSDWIVLTREKHTLRSYQPVLFHRGEEINTRTKLLLAFRSVLIEKVTGIVLSYGQIIYGPDFSSVTISLSTFITKVKGMLCRVDELATQQDPAFFYADPVDTQAH
jgi:hypothetical protein